MTQNLSLNPQYITIDCHLVARLARTDHTSSSKAPAPVFTPVPNPYPVPAPASAPAPATIPAPASDPASTASNSTVPKETLCAACLVQEHLSPSGTHCSSDRIARN